MAPSLERRLVPYLLALLLLAGFVWLFWSQRDEGGPRDEIREVLRKSLTTDRPADCARLYTRRFLEQVTRERGPAALRECRQEADGDPDAASVAVRSLRLGPTRAKAAVHVRGGEMGGTELTVGLVNDALGWKLDRLARVDIDMASYRHAQLAGAAEEGIPRDEANCMMRRIAAALGERGLERAMLAGGEPIGRMGLACVSATTIRRSLAQDMAEDDIPPPIAACILDRLAGGAAGEARALLRLPEGKQRRLGRQAAIECARAQGLAPAAA